LKEEIWSQHLPK